MFVVFRIVRAVFSIANAIEPVSILLVPLDGPLKAGFEGNLWSPAEFILYLLAVQSVTAIVSGAV